jgi:glycosyltransferase involved in cell wall biosynthesis
MLKASMVIPTYYRSNDLCHLFKSLLRQLVKPEEVLVIDDTPTAEIKDLCAKYDAKLFKAGITLIYVKNHRERSISVARNLGAKMAHGDIIMFLDTDVIPYPDYTEKILDTFKKYPEVKGVGGWMRPAARDLDFVGRLRYNFLQRLCKLFSLNQDSRNSCKNYEYPIMLSSTIYCQWLLGGGMSFRSSIFNEFKFDENLKGYSFGEDFLFSNLICMRYPRSLLMTPDAKCTNAVSEEARLRGKELFNIKMRNGKYILTKLWGFKGLILFGRQRLGFLIFEVIENIHKLTHPALQ